jgi:hypothetical protein
MLRFVTATTLGVLCFLSTSHATPVCVDIGDICADDCDCCGYDHLTDQYGVRCEQRFDRQGERGFGFKEADNMRRCYQCVFTGHTCTRNKECCSQKCVEGSDGVGVCMKNHPPPKPCYESLLTSINSIQAISGHPLHDEELCPCTDLTQSSIAINIMAAIDKKTNRDYVNNYPIDSGLSVSTSHHAPLRKMKICSNQDCPECDPCAYKIEGLCENEHMSSNNFEFIQEGPLTMPTARGECIEIPVVGRHQYAEYKVTFPCLTGGFDGCSNELPPAAYDQPRAPGCEDGCLGEFAEIGYQWHDYNSRKDETIFVYSYRNFMNYQTREAVVDLDHFTYPFSGECRFEEIMFVKLSHDPNYPVPEFVYNTTDIHMFTEERDADLCMYGAEISPITPEGEQVVVGDNQYGIAVRLQGNVEATQMQYGVYGKSGRRDYQYSMMPDCTNTVASYCENYPMKISELDLLGKCEQFTNIESEQWSTEQ